MYSLGIPEHDPPHTGYRYPPPSQTNSSIACPPMLPSDTLDPPNVSPFPQL